MESEPGRQSSGRRIALVSATLVVLALVAGVAWWEAGNGDDSTVVQVPPPPGASVVATPIRLTSAVEPPASAPEAAAASVASAPDEVQICGGSWVRLAANGDPDGDSVAKATGAGVAALEAEVLAAMESSSDERVQAAAHVYQFTGPRFSRIPTSDCKGDAACESEAGKQAEESLRHREALAGLARNSTDAQIYAWAYQACGGGPKRTEGQCQLINAPQWSRLDPANAVPWLAVAKEAAHDRPALDDAMFHVAASERYDSGAGAMTGILLDHMPPGEDNMYGALSVAARAIGFEAANEIRNTQALGACRSEDLADANRRGLCDKIAELLVGRSTTLLPVIVGRSMGKRLGWPSDRITTLEMEANAFNAALTAESVAMQTLSCHGLQAPLDRLRDYASIGEVESLRRRIATLRPEASTLLPLATVRAR